MGDLPMGDLAERLKSKGLSLISAAPAPLGGSEPLKAASLGGGDAAARAAARAAPTPLGMSKSEKRDLFTPLQGQGEKALKKEKVRQLEGEEELFQSFQNTLRKWVQECLARDGKRDKLIEKGALVCRLQAKWSEGLHGKISKYVKGYGAKLAAEGEKNDVKRVAWLPSNEKWMVGFDIAALEAFAEAHPDVVEPPCAHVRNVVDDLVAKGQIPSSPEALTQVLEGRFGPLRKACVDRARYLAKAKKGSKRKGGPGTDPESAANPRKTSMEALEDVTWAVSTLAPVGLRPDSGELVLRAPAAIVVPIFEALRALEDRTDLVQLLKDTGLGKVVAAYRHHPNQKVANMSRDVVNSWKAACKKK